MTMVVVTHEVEFAREVADVSFSWSRAALPPVAMWLKCLIILACRDCGVSGALAKQQSAGLSAYAPPSSCRLESAG